MINVFKFSNWNQLSGLKSLDYPNITIKVTQFKCDALTGTRISIIDTDNHMTYFAGFIRVMNSTRFNPLAVFEVGDMIKVINSYGFNIEIIEPTKLPPNVITMLEGLQALGYQYITLQYIRSTNTENKALYQSNIDDNEHNYWQDRHLPPPNIVYSNKYIVATKYLGDLPAPYTLNDNQPTNSNLYVISKAPEFNWEDFKWVEPTRVYSIEELLNPENGFVSNAIVDMDDTPNTDTEPDGD